MEGGVYHAVPSGVTRPEPGRFTRGKASFPRWSVDFLCQITKIAGFMTDSPAPHTAPRRLLVIYNPTAGGRRRQRFEAVLAGLANFGCPMDVRPTTGPGDAALFAREADAAAHDLVVAAGGDGTINEVINGLLGHAGPGREVEVPLAVLPMGTANVLAAELGLGLVPANNAIW